MRRAVGSVLAALRSRAWWNSQLSFRRSAAWMFGIVVPVAVLAVPSKVSVDGIYYVLGAKTLFTPEFATLYPLFREPGYPAFLTLVHLFSGASLVVVGAQAALLTFAAFAGLYVVHRTSGRTTVTRYVLCITIALVLNPMFLTYAGHFMQQAFFAGLLACYAVLAEWARALPSRVRRWHILLMLIALNVVTVWSSVGWLYLGLFASVLVASILLIPVVTRRLTRSRVVRVVTTVLLVGVVGATTVVADRAVYAAWEHLRDAQRSTNDQASVTLKPLESAPSLPTPEKLVSLYGTLLGIGVTEPYPKDNDQFLAEQMRVRFFHSEWDTAYVREPYTSAALGYFALDDPSIVAHTIYALGSQPIGGFTVAGIAYSLVMLLGHAVLIVAFVRRQWFLAALLMIPVSWLGVYALSNTPIDRYGIPAYPLLVGAVALACDTRWWKGSERS